MNWTQLWLLAFLAISCLTYLAVGSPLKVMSAPNLLRVGTAENIFVECQDCTGGDINVDISVMNFPTKTKMLASIHVTLTSADRFQGFGQITIPAEDFNKDPTLKQRVYLQAQFPDRLLEKVVLVSFQSGYIFIQTDKTLYTPNSIVHFRMFAVTPRMEPVERDTPTSTYASVTIEIVTPEDIIFSLDTVSLKSGIHSGSYQLGEIVSLGLWKVVARFHSNPQQSYSAEFEVKEYVLPSFEVKVIPTSSFFYVDSPQLTINIKATYLFGEEVDGTAFVVFGVVHEGQKKSFPDSIQRVPIVQGEGVVTLKRAHITQTFHINNLVGDSIFVAVSVLTENGGEMVQAELGGIQIVTSPYTVHFKKSPKYFKPGITCGELLTYMNIYVEVLNRDETPAKGVEVVVDPGDVLALTDANGMARVDLNTMPQSSSLTITARTNDPGISRERQASATMTALPYKTKSNNYIHIGVDTAELELGDNLKINFIFSRELNNQDTDVTYLILSRGQLVKHGHYRNRGQVLISLVFRITKEMLPSFRIIAYYHTNDNEVVSDSVWVDVKDSCMGSLTLESSRPAVSYEPRWEFGLRVTGDPGATVGLVAVDKVTYFLNNKHRLTQKKIWDTLEKSDTGCTPGGGADSMGVFFDAGLLFESSTGSGTPYRQDLKCPSPTRRKRASRTLEVTTDLEEEDLEDRSNEIVSRTIFPESWLWSTIKLPACPGQEPNCVSTSFMKRFPLSDSITTWQIIGISLSRTHGICVSNPLEAVVSKQFFIDLKLPYSAVKGEQLEIKAVLHNYFPEPAIVLVELLEEEHVCSAASNRARYRHEVVVQPETTRSVPFIIIPMREGQFRIEVKAVVKDSSLSDGIMKMLRVVPEGVLTKSESIITLNPAEKGVDGIQEEIIRSDISRKHMVPNTPMSTTMYLTGKRQHSGLVEDVIGGKSMGSLIYRPSGTGEGNMIHMTMPAIATMYLDKTNQWETVGVEKRNEALEHIKTGYQNELAYRKKDGSFSVFPNHPSSTWLTAYVAKVFAMANSLVAVESSVICDAVKYVILNAQQPDGMFREIGPIFHGEMTGDVRGKDSDASMTAFCLIAMQESRTLCAATVNVLPGSVEKAVAYLEGRLPSLVNSYAVAMTSYALANENKLNQQILYTFASQEFSHWVVPGSHVYTMEATAYALLALVKVKMVSTYYNLPGEKKSDCEKFNLSVQILPENVDDDEKIYKLRIEVLYNDTERDAAMSVLDIGLPTGFTVNKGDLDLLSRNRTRTIANYEMTSVLSERDSLIIYLDKVSHTQPEEIAFRIHRTLKVDVLHPAAVSVYEYYDQTHCVKFYHPERSGELMRLCRNEECICGEGYCSKLQKDKTRHESRAVKACESTAAYRTDYVYKVRLAGFEQVSSVDIYTMEIVKVIKSGYTDVNPLNELRKFTSHPQCRQSLELTVGKTYLLMGTDKNIRRNPQSQMYEYDLLASNWIEYWPTDPECPAVQHRCNCVTLREFNAPACLQ
ncbi:LOW QUALITY PROTEIN: complement C3-like [Seriola aureovittata]|uniref:LOW QUALITY PROTEIN: complement C3-like n=1 Tax=Seriola aureovittata TaxID=2871759 RepID=UPI0024BDD8FB|nr:LOW QUALITY PROTEIN: complement C3-like [Seriola aureovittata]